MRFEDLSRQWQSYVASLEQRLSVAAAQNAELIHDIGELRTAILVLTIGFLFVFGFMLWKFKSREADRGFRDKMHRKAYDRLVGYLAQGKFETDVPYGIIVVDDKVLVCAYSPTGMTATDILEAVAGGDGIALSVDRVTGKAAPLMPVEIASLRRRIEPPSGSPPSMPG